MYVSFTYQQKALDPLITEPTGVSAKSPQWKLSTKKFMGNYSLVI